MGRRGAFLPMGMRAAMKDGARGSPSPSPSAIMLVLSERVSVRACVRAGVRLRCCNNSFGCAACGRPPGRRESAEYSAGRPQMTRRAGPRPCSEQRANDHTSFLCCWASTSSN